jgi:transcriptional regulator with XRE-family HTH domain
MPWPGASYNRQIPAVPAPKKNTPIPSPTPAKRATSFEPDVARAFGSVVRAERNRLAIAQDQFALLANVDRSYFGKLERGERQPSLALMLRVAGGLGCSGADLVARVEQVLGPSPGAVARPAAMVTEAQRALYDHIGDGPLALRVDKAVRESLADGWRDQPARLKRVRTGIRYVLSTGIPADSGLAAREGSDTRRVPVDLDTETDLLLELVVRQAGY